MLDLGWATQIGEWVVDLVKFPNGTYRKEILACSNNGGVVISVKDIKDIKKGIAAQYSI